MPDPVVATAVGAATLTLGLSALGLVARRDGAPEAATHDGPQWIASGHRAVLLDPSVTDDRDGQTVYPAHVSVDREATVDLEVMR
jgi:hypothetical protein